MATGNKDQPPSVWENIAELLGKGWKQFSQMSSLAQVVLVILVLYGGYQIFNPGSSERSSRLEMENRRAAEETERVRNEAILQERMQVIADEAEFVQAIRVDGSIVDVVLTERVFTAAAQEMANMTALTFAKERDRILGLSNVTARVVYNGYVLASADANKYGLR